MALRTKLRIFCCLGVSSPVMGPPYLYLYTVFVSLTREATPAPRHSTRAYNSRQTQRCFTHHGETLRIRPHPHDPRAAPGKAAHRPGTEKGAGPMVGQE